MREINHEPAHTRDCLVAQDRVPESTSVTNSIKVKNLRVKSPAYEGARGKREVRLMIVWWEVSINGCRGVDASMQGCHCRRKYTQFQGKTRGKTSVLEFTMAASREAAVFAGGGDHEPIFYGPVYTRIPCKWTMLQNTLRFIDQVQWYRPSLRDIFIGSLLDVDGYPKRCYNNQIGDLKPS